MNRHIAQPHAQAGISMVELMVAIALGLAILAGMTTILVANSNSRQEIEKTSRQIENGRYAIQLLSEDLQLAGFLGSYVPPTTAPTMLALPDPCATDLPTLDAALALHVQGYDDGVAAPACLVDVKPNTDIIVVRHASTCAVGEANCDIFLPNAPHLQVSGCSTDTVTYKIDNIAANLTLKRVGCAAAAAVRRYRTHIYFIANNNVGSDGIPTLKRAELGTTVSIVALVEGIENMQLEYGIDTDNNGSPDLYNADPSSLNACNGNACVQNWWNVMTVKVDLLARNTQPTAGYTNSKIYTLGADAAGQLNTVGPFNDGYKRHAYTGIVRLGNPAGRRE